MDTNDVNRSHRSDDAERVGLGSGQRYRCAACGNVTRFDVEVTERARRYWHADLSGRGTIDSQELETAVHQVTCRWCGATDVVIEPRPAAGMQTPASGRDGRAEGGANTGAPTDAGSGTEAGAGEGQERTST